MSIPIIKLTHLSKNYGEFTAVDRLNLTIQKGEIYGLLGPNGAGKTTSILMMLGLTDPTEGTAMVCGINATRNPIQVKQKVGYLPDRVGFYDDLSGLENLSLIARLNGHSLTDADALAKETLADVGLTTAMNKKTSTYSRGMKQRLGLADVLIKQPEVVIMDEPTLGIDPTGITEFLALIKQLSQKQGLTVLLSSHHLQQVQRICDRVGIFVKGKLLVEGEIDTLEKNLLENEGFTSWINLVQPPADPIQLENELKGLAFVQSVNIDKNNLEIKSSQENTPQIVRFLVHRNADIISVNRKTYSLEDIYRKYFEEEKKELDAPKGRNRFYKNYRRAVGRTKNTKKRI